MPKRTTPVDAAAPVRVVVVTMDSHLAGAAEAASRTLRRELPGLELAVHAADEWGSDNGALRACRDDGASTAAPRCEGAAPSPNSGSSRNIPSRCSSRPIISGWTQVSKRTLAPSKPICGE